MKAVLRWVAMALIMVGGLQMPWRRSTIQGAHPYSYAFQ